MDDQAHALVYQAPGQAAVCAVDLPPMQDGMVEVETLFSGLSRGTERLVFNGAVPQSEWDRMRAPLQSGDFPFPVRYGYAATGRITGGPRAGQSVFCLHPHQSVLRVADHSAIPIPPDVPPERAILAANMETALNAIWDARLRPGQRCLVVGAGLLGWLITVLLSRRGDLSVDVTDIDPASGGNADDFHVRFMSPPQVPAGAYEVVFHTSASGPGLQTGIDALGFEGRVIELSWYGNRPVNVQLGGNFHAGRVSIIASQVGHVAPVRRPSTGYADRLGLALLALADPRLDALITEDVRFRDLPERLPHLLGDGAPGIATRIVY